MYRKAIKIKTEYIDPYILLGGLLNDLGNFKEAEVVLQKPIELKPNSSEAYFRLGIVFKSIWFKNLQFRL
tara:strand:- start:327 stop:536 length:210 start_codon:yes stop_codon:yes gene_type:complete